MSTDEIAHLAVGRYAVNLSRGLQDVAIIRNDFDKTFELGAARDFGPSVTSASIAAFVRPLVALRSSCGPRAARLVSCGPAAASCSVRSIPIAPSSKFDSFRDRLLLVSDQFVLSVTRKSVLSSSLNRVRVSALRNCRAASAQNR